jgi:hypothetical protein
MWSDEMKEIRRSYDVSRGYLGVPVDYVDDNNRNYSFGGINWYSCREDFHRCSIGLRFHYFAYCYPAHVQAGESPNVPRNISAFFDKIEDTLGLNIRTKMGMTVLPSGAITQAMWIKRPLWWTCENMRRSLFTALLRAGLVYDPNRDNFDQALRSQDYTALTMPAVNRFLKGYTSYKGSTVGWQSAFRDQPKKSLETLLVLPARKRRNVERS